MNPPGNPPGEKSESLRRIPQVNDLVEAAAADGRADGIPRRALTEAARELTVRLRASLLAADGIVTEQDLAIERLADWVASEAARAMRPSLRRVINATGVVLHTNLGRAPLAPVAMEAVRDACEGYCNLEYALEEGSRGSRQSHTEEILCALTGAEAAMVVNNNAAAVLLVLAALARDREVIVSRGELVEIGDSFRLPDIMRQGGARLVEVGTTNRTRASDYLNAISPDTALLLKIHQSNFRIVGYSEDVSLGELVEIGRHHFIPVVEDMGSGCLLDLDRIGLHGEHTAAESIATGADLVTFSGDKLLGGPQAGIVTGLAGPVDSLRSHPLARALRPDKMTVAALEATLLLHMDPDAAWSYVPVLSKLVEPAGAVASRARRLKRAVERRGASTFVCEVVPETSRAGGGSLPTTEIPTFCLRITSPDLKAEEMEERMRSFDTPVLARVKDGALLLDMRTVDDAELSTVAAAVSSLGG